MSACSLEFAPHVTTLTGSSVRARSATGQVTKSLGKKTVNFDINGIAAGVNMEVLKISKPIVSAGKMVRSGRRIVRDGHDSFIEDKKKAKRIPVELTRGDVFEISAYMSPNSHGLPKRPVLICPEVEEAEDPGHEELDESIPEPDVVPKGVAVPETPSEKDREAHELTHLTTQPWCSVCVRAKGVDERHLRRPAGERAETQGMVDSVIQCLSDDCVFEQILSEETIPECESACFGGVAQSSARTNSSVATRRRRSIWVNCWCYSSVCAVACETRHLAADQFSAQTEWCDRVRKSEVSVIQKTIDAIW